jgi:hypothetical protein
MFGSLLRVKHRCLQVGDIIAVVGETIGKFEVVADGERGGYSDQRNKDDAEKLHFAWVCCFNLCSRSILEGDLGLSVMAFTQPSHAQILHSVSASRPGPVPCITAHRLTVNNSPAMRRRSSCCWE